MNPKEMQMLLLLKTLQIQAGINFVNLYKDSNGNSFYSFDPTIIGA